MVLTANMLIRRNTSNGWLKRKIAKTNWMITACRMKFKDFFNGIKDNGDGVCYHVFVYNVQPGIEIDYMTGENKLRD